MQELLRKPTSRYITRKVNPDGDWRPEHCTHCDRPVKRNVTQVSETVGYVWWSCKCKQWQLLPFQLHPLEWQPQPDENS